MYSSNLLINKSASEDCTTKQMQITPLISFFITFLVSFDAVKPFSPHGNTLARVDNILKVIANIWNFIFQL